MENGSINSKPTNTLSTDQAHRTSGSGTDSSTSQHQYGKTLNVPDPNSLHPNPTSIASPAPLNPPRPAIMSTPKSSMIAVKTPATSIGLSPTETRPLLLVTTENANQQPETKAISQGRRLPLNGRLATISTTKQRQTPANSNNDHRTVNETTCTQRAPNRKYSASRPRTALFFSSTRKSIAIIFFRNDCILFFGTFLCSSTENRRPRSIT